MSNIDKIVNSVLLHSSKPITYFRLSKTLYFLQGLCLVKYNEPLFTEEISAWTNGPCVPDVYKKFHFYGCYDLRFLLDVNKEFSEKDAFISSICKELDKYSDEQLMKMSQNKGMPWEVVWNNGNGRFNEISTNLMKILFKEKYEA